MKEDVLRPAQLVDISRLKLSQIKAANGGVVTIQWSAMAGLNYRLQSKPELGESSWMDVAGDVTSNGPSAMKTDLAGATGQRFYRVIVLP